MVSKSRTVVAFWLAEAPKRVKPSRMTSRPSTFESGFKQSMMVSNMGNFGYPQDLWFLMILPHCAILCLESRVRRLVELGGNAFSFAVDPETNLPSLNLTIYYFDHGLDEGNDLPAINQCKTSLKLKHVEATTIIVGRPMGMSRGLECKILPELAEATQRVTFVNPYEGTGKALTEPASIQWRIVGARCTPCS